VKSGEPTCLRCGNCCRHAGEVRLAEQEAATIAGFLGLSVHDFAAQYTRLRPDRRGLSLTEQPDGACVFLDSSPSACRIHAVKPQQCRDFPAGWRYDDLATICAAVRASTPPINGPST
jgi:uncharacterized protein